MALITDWPHVQKPQQAKLKLLLINSELQNTLIVTVLYTHICISETDEILCTPFIYIY